MKSGCCAGFQRRSPVNTFSTASDTIDKAKALADKTVGEARSEAARMVKEAKAEADAATTAARREVDEIDAKDLLVTGTYVPASNGELDTRMTLTRQKDAVTTQLGQMLSGLAGIVPQQMMAPKDDKKESERVAAQG